MSAPAWLNGAQIVPRWHGVVGDERHHDRALRTDQPDLDAFGLADPVEIEGVDVERRARSPASRATGTSTSAPHDRRACGSRPSGSRTRSVRASSLATVAEFTVETDREHAFGVGIERLSGRRRRTPGPCGDRRRDVVVRAEPEVVAEVERQIARDHPVGAGRAVRRDLLVRRG